MKTIRGKKAMVTGAASGIGRAIALALARERADLYLMDIDEPRRRISVRDAEALDSTVSFQICDLASPAQISACAAACLGAFSNLDILVNGAGVFHYGHLGEMATEQWNAAISVNLLAPIQLVRELIPKLAKQRQSHILNVRSILGLVPERSYQTSKLGLVEFSLALRTGYAAHNVSVTALCPVSSIPRC
jgi:NAD(P)-dependent dehydrogenase (short-subunit alcohol dehydrogenase family)